ncbi:MAG TPA: ABC transporter ATP-binding protein [Ramlibacter sp.]|uniref:ABC transporter ATP-binding protein n=1 Tax=Ramlibacter sp. TaxID=1917967 RepID=UPI002ED4D2D6
MATELLALDRVNAFYGDSHVLHDVSLQVRPGRLLALLGRNGAGKSTCMQAIAGLLPPRSGRIRLGGAEVQGSAPEAICRRGVGFVPQGRRIFPTLTVRENLDVAARRGAGGGKRWSRDDVQAIFPRLKEREKQLAGSLSGGEQQMLAIGRALMTSPVLLLLDEPSEGLAPQIVHELGRVLDKLKDDISILLVEQNLGLALQLADDVVLLNTGRVVFDGTREEFDTRQPELQRHLGIA